MTYLPTEEHPLGDGNIEIHQDLADIIVEVAEATANQTSPLYGFNDHYWTVEELHEAYKVKTGKDFID